MVDLFYYRTVNLNEEVKKGEEEEEELPKEENLDEKL